jgi:hypothetical protein
MEKCSTSETSASSGKNRWEQQRLCRSLGGIEDKLKNLTTGAAVTVEINPGQLARHGISDIAVTRLIT